MEIYPDRIDVLNPGGLWGGKTLDNLADGTSRCRNDLLMSLVSSIPSSSRVAAPAEGQGSGIGMMERELQARNLPALEFEAGFDFFRVRFHRSIPGEGRVQLRSSGVQNELSSAQREVLALFGGDPLLELSVREISSSLGLPIGTTRARLKRLVGSQLLVPTAPATDRLRRYRLAKSYEKGKED